MQLSLCKPDLSPQEENTTVQTVNHDLKFQILCLQNKMPQFTTNIPQLVVEIMILLMAEVR